jgi:hypothetical protein
MIGTIAASSNNFNDSTPSDVTGFSGTFYSSPDRVELTWNSSTIASGNIAGYKLEMNVDGDIEWSIMYTGSNLSYIHNIINNNTFNYRIKAYSDSNVYSNSYAETTVNT